MTISTETLMAYVDGELPPEEMAHAEAEIAANPELARYVAEQRALSRDLHAAFDEVLNAPMPDTLTAAVMRGTKPQSGRAWRDFLARRFWVWTGLPVGAALAAGAALGVLLIAPASDIVAGRSGLVARGGLETALNGQLAAEQTASAEAKIGISFRNHSGDFCRTFTAQRVAGVACHESGAWQIAALAQTEGEAQGAYTPAASAMPDAIRSAVTAMIAGAPLDAAGERRAQTQGWNPR